MFLGRYVNTKKETFDEVPVTKIDVLAITWLTYFDMRELSDRLPMSFAALKSDPYSALLESKHESFIPKTCATMFRAMMDSPRYRDCVLLDYEHLTDADRAVQFGALAVEMGGYVVIAFEGTDLSFVGWKEDFIMSYSDSIASYPLAERFIEKVLSSTQKPIILTGHSKGGNIAAYCLATAESDERIVAAYSFEGPGFHNPAIFANHPERAEKLHKFIPQSSIVGVLLSNETQVHIVRSTSVGIFQHNAFKWVIQDDDFVYMQKTTASSKSIDNAINGWLASLNDEDRKRFVDICFDTLDQSKARSLPYLVKHLFSEIPSLRVAYRNLGSEDKDFMKRTSRQLAKRIVSSGRQSIFGRLAPKGKPTTEKTSNKANKRHIEIPAESE